MKHLIIYKRNGKCLKKAITNKQSESLITFAKKET